MRVLVAALFFTVTLAARCELKPGGFQISKLFELWFSDLLQVYLRAARHGGQMRRRFRALLLDPRFDSCLTVPKNMLKLFAMINNFMRSYATPNASTERVADQQAL